MPEQVAAETVAEATAGDADQPSIASVEEPSDDGATPAAADGSETDR